MLGFNAFDRVAHRSLLTQRRPWALDLNFLSGYVDPRIVLTRPAATLEFNGSGVLASVASGQPVVGYDYVTRACRGLRLIGEQYTNRQPYSDVEGVVGAQPTSMYPASQSIVVSTEQSLGPNGQSAKHTILSAADSNVGYMSGAGTYSAGDTVCAACWLWFPPGFSIDNIRFGFEGAAITGGTVLYTGFANKSITGRWQQIYTAATLGATGAATPVLRPAAGLTSGHIGQYFYSDCWQITSGSVPPPWVSTGASQVTMPADVAYMPLGSLLPAGEGTIVVESTLIGPKLGGVVASVQDAAGTTNFARIRQSTGGSNILAQVSSAAGLSSGLAGVPGVVGVPFKFALRFRGGQIAAAQGGGNLATSTVPASLGAMDRIVFSDGVACSQYLRRVRLASPYISDAQLQALTL